MPSVLLIRHGQASFGAAEYDELSDLGVRQAEALADRLSRLDPYALTVEGSLARQRATTSILLGDVDGGSRRTDPRWDEYDHRDILEVAASDPELRDEFAVLEQDDVDRARAFQRILDVALRRWARGDGQRYAESWEGFAARAWDATDEMLDELDAGQTALVVTSGGVISAVVARVLGLDAGQWQALNRVIVNTSISRVVRGRGGTNIVTINDHAHLEGTDDLLTYR